MQHILTLLLATLPAFALAATAPTSFKTFVEMLVDLIELLIYVVFALTFLVFAWGMIRGWIIGGGDAKSVESGKNMLFAGIIALVVMSAVWGMVYILKASLFGE